MNENHVISEVKIFKDRTKKKSSRYI